MSLNQINEDAMLIDAHAHVYPRLGTDSGDQGKDVQLKLIQHHVQYHVQGWRRRRDHARADLSLLMPSGDGISYQPEVNLRVAHYGQLECTVDGEDYYLQWYPCWFRDMSAPPELMIAYMDYLGVEMAVLQHDHIYGSLDEVFSDCMQRYPGRFLPLAQVREWEADQETQVQRLEHSIRSRGFKGLYFAVEPLTMNDWQFHFDDRRLEPLWQTVEDLGIPIFWYLYTRHRDSVKAYLDQVERLDRWAKAHPSIPCVHTHGLDIIAMRLGRPDSERFDIPAAVLNCLKNPNMHVEIMLQLMAPDTEYPFPWAQETLRMLHGELGPEKLIWGSDMPAAERNVTYRQARDYVRRHAEFMSEADKDLFFGENVARVLGLDAR
ncbi:MAG: amidohydrolase [Planctomycetes bacterium]|nr:amidohydrolase [Planctomycetota bacterium]